MGRFYLIVILLVLLVTLLASKSDASHQRRQTQRNHRKAVRYCRSIGDKSSGCPSRKKAADYNQRKEAQKRTRVHLPNNNNSQQSAFPGLFVKINDFFNNVTSYFQ